MKLGVDPEFFILDRHNKPINAFSVCQGTKYKPYKSNDIEIFYDNVLLEFNTLPASNITEFLGTISKAIFETVKVVGNNSISLLASIDFDEAELDAFNAQEFGCVPDFDAYTLTQNDTAESLLKHSTFRTAGGHIHIGGQNTDIVCHPLMKPMFVFMLDLFVGIPSILIDHGTDSYKRRKYFGRAGSHRDKPYGLEYRVLSPFWLRNKSTTQLIYKLVEFVFDNMNDSIYKKFFNFNVDKLKSDNPETAYDCFGYDLAAVANTINECNFDKAKNFWMFASNFMPNHLIEQVEYEMNQPKVLTLV